VFFFCNFQRWNGYINQGRRRANDRARRTEREDSIRRTVYVSELDHTVSNWWLPEHALLYIYSWAFVRSNDIDHILGDGGETCWYLCYLRASKLFHLKILICTGTCVLQIWNSLLYCLSWSTKVIKQSLLSYHIYCFVFFFHF